MSIGIWTVAEAKGQSAQQRPADHRQEWLTAVVVVSAEEWEHKTRRPGNLAELFAESPLRKVPRMKDGPREVELSTSCSNQRSVRMDKPRPDAVSLPGSRKLTRTGSSLALSLWRTCATASNGLPAGAQRKRPDAWMTEQLPLRFEERLLAIDAETANIWGRLMAEGQAAGHPPATMDAFIAATVLRHDMTLVTRNVSDFEALRVRLVNPWSNDRGHQGCALRPHLRFVQIVTLSEGKIHHECPLLKERGQTHRATAAGWRRVSAMPWH
jgi:predicted nucleic acid-binding protein